MKRPRVSQLLPGKTDNRPANPDETPNAADPVEAPADALLPDTVDTTDANIEDRPYIEVRPSEAAVDPSAAIRAMEQLQTHLRNAGQTSLRERLFGTTDDPVVEWLLVADGREDTSVRYLVGTSAPDGLDAVERILRRAFPTSYELKRIETHPRRLEAQCSPSRSTGPDTITETPPADHPLPDTTPAVAGVTYVGKTERTRDWQTGLTPAETFRGRATDTTDHQRHSTTTTNTEDHTNPLATLVETLCAASMPALFQVVCRAHPDWTIAADTYIQDLQTGQATRGDRILEAVAPRDPEGTRTYDPPESDKRRIASIQRRNPTRSLCVAARAAILTRDDPADANHTANELATVLEALSGPTHAVQGIVRDAAQDPDTDDGAGQAVYERLCARECPSPTYDRRFSRLRPGLTGSPGLVVDPTELPGFCLLDGAGLTSTGQRALAIRPAERTALTLPPPTQLSRYEPPGQLLCMPLTDDRRPTGDPLCLPPDLQSRHTVVTGDTGSGKSIQMLTAMLSNVPATDGPEILFDYKGDGMAQNYLRAHYAAYGDLEDVLYFDLTETLPALSVLDGTPLLEAGLPLEEVRSRLAGHFEEVLASLMHADSYAEAQESAKAVRNHLRALYDPVHGEVTVSLDDLGDALQRTRQREMPPPVTDPELASYFDALLDGDPKMFRRVMSGASNRLETIATDARVAPLFETTDEDDDAGRLAFGDLVDENKVVLFDFGGMEAQAKQALTLGILSSLWTALRARSEATATTAAPPQVNLYLDDAKDVAATSIVGTLLAQGRSFGLSLALGVQYPAQLESADPEDDTYRELLNETATWVVGNVSTADGLADVLATDTMRVPEVRRRLGAMRRGEWLVRPGAGFGEATPRPFLGRSLPAPRGHPASAAPLSRATELRLDRAAEAVRECTRNQHGTAHNDLGTDFGETDGEPEVEASAFMSGGVDGDADNSAAEASSNTDADTETGGGAAHPRLDSLLPYTERLPDPISYDEGPHALRCGRCNNRYDPTVEGIADAVNCCHDLAGVDPDDIPICRFNLKLTPEEVQASEWHLRQLLFLQAVYNAQQRRYDPYEYDIVWDSMIRLQEYVGIDTDAVDKLVDSGLLRHDSDHPHRLYSVAPDGREVIGESYREGVEYGHGAGDLEESSEHVLGIALGERHLQRAYVEDGDSPVTEVSPYHEVTVDGTKRRLDIAGVDADGKVVVAVEVERLNHDHRRAVLEDFDKMAACDVAEAIWVVMTQADGHNLVDALYDPVEGDPRLGKTYAQTTPLPQFKFDEPGLTDIYSVEKLRESVDEDPNSG